MIVEFPCDKYIDKIKDAIKTSKTLPPKNQSSNRFEKSPYYEIPPEIELTYDYVKDVGKLVKNNDLIADYYYHRYKEDEDETFLYKFKNVRDCGKYWHFDHYEKQKVYDLHHVYHCKDKFCHYCQKLLQATRLHKYQPLIEDLLKQGKHLYHVVFTVKNTRILNKIVISALFENFKRFVRYCTGDAKNRLGLKEYAFLGALRSLEITYTEEDYHPHVHCILAFDNPVPDKAYIVNKFSYKKENGKRVLKRKFTDFEVLLQKLWYLLYNGIEATPKNVNALKLGYSCTVDKITENNYYEVFKYTVKFEKQDDETPVMTYEQFRTLYDALYKLHIFQGYGIFYRTDVDEIDESMSAKYDFIISQLKIIESSVMCSFKIEDLAFKFLMSPESKFISRKTIYKFLRENPEFLANKNEH